MKVDSVRSAGILRNNTRMLNKQTSDALKPEVSEYAESSLSFTGVNLAPKDKAVQQMTQLRNSMLFAILGGNYKEYKNSAIEHAKIAVKNKDLLPNIKGAEVKGMPLLSVYGLRFLKIKFLDMFRIKTPEEKELIQFAKDYRKEQKLKKQFEKRDNKYFYKK